MRALIVRDVGKDHEGTVLKEVARITLAIPVMGAALRLPPGYERQNWRELVAVLGLGMPLMWLASAAADRLSLKRVVSQSAAQGICSRG